MLNCKEKSKKKTGNISLSTSIHRLAGDTRFDSEVSYFFHRYFFGLRAEVTTLGNMKKTPLLFDLENEARKRIEFSGRRLPEVKIGQIWWYYVGVNIGQEISKGSPHLRPCILLQTIPRTSLIKVIPLSSKLHSKRSEYYLNFESHEKYKLKQSWILLHQSQIIDKIRLIRSQSTKQISKGFLRKLRKNIR